ncbi:hypothetical protein NJI34_13585 [Pseudomonas sp. S 311-6]|nr:hypothetical protein [Pseudomonas sp. S 311-6]
MLVILAGRDCDEWHVLKAAAIPVALQYLQSIMLISVVTWIALCLVHLFLLVQYGSFYLAFGHLRTAWHSLGILQSLALFFSLLSGLSWCGALISSVCTKRPFMICA